METDNARLHSRAIIEKDEVDKLFAGFGLSVGNVRPLESGIINTNLVVDTNHGQYVLRAYSEERTAEEVGFEIEVLDALEAAAVSAQRVLRDSRAEPLHSVAGRLAVVLTFLPGETLPDFSPNVSVAARIGEQLADMQRALRIPPRSHKERRDGEFIGALLACQTEMLKKRGDHAEAKFLNEAWSLYGAPFVPDPPADHVVHADICPANVVFAGDRLSGFIDFDDAYYGSGITDVAVALMEFSAREDQHLDRDAARAFIDGFAVRAGTRPSGDELLANMRLNCFRYLSYTLPLTLAAGKSVASNIYHQRLRYLNSEAVERLIDEIQ